MKAIYRCLKDWHTGRLKDEWNVYTATQKSDTYVTEGGSDMYTRWHRKSDTYLTEGESDTYTRWHRKVTHTSLKGRVTCIHGDTQKWHMRLWREEWHVSKVVHMDDTNPVSYASLKEATKLLSNTDQLWQKLAVWNKFETKFSNLTSLLVCIKFVSDKKCYTLYNEVQYVEICLYVCTHSVMNLFLLFNSKSVNLEGLKNKVWIVH